MGAERREFELENALRDLIAYMKAMPMVPANYEAIRNAEAVLKKGCEPTVLEAVKTTPIGLVAVAARIYGRSLLLKTSDLSGKERAWPKHKDHLYRKLVEGYLLELKPSPDVGFHLFGPDIEKQKAFNDSIDK